MAGVVSNKCRRILPAQVMRVLCEAQILHAVDHPFLASLWGTISTPTHLHFLMEPCSGGELYAVLNAQPNKRFSESTMRFYAAEVCPACLLAAFLLQSSLKQLVTPCIAMLKCSPMSALSCKVPRRPARLLRSLLPSQPRFGAAEICAISALGLCCLRQARSRAHCVQA